MSSRYFLREKEREIMEKERRRSQEDTGKKEKARQRRACLPSPRLSRERR
jgi:hypothetical protein